MVNNGSNESLERPLAAKINPAEEAGEFTRDCVESDQELAAVYSMVWISQLALRSPIVVPNDEFFMVKVGAAVTAVTTQVHLSVTEKLLVFANGMS